MDLFITNACAVRNATERAVPRHRVRAASDEDVALIVGEAKKSLAFAVVPFVERPSPPPAPTETTRGMWTPLDAEKALQWACSKLFSTFFTVPNLDTVPGPAGVAPTGGRGDLAAGDSSGGENGPVVDTVSPVGSMKSSHSEYSRDEINNAAGESGTCSSSDSLPDATVGAGEDTRLKWRGCA